MERTLKSQLCERLKDTRIQAGFKTAKEFSESKAIKVSTYALHEAGTRGMSLDVIEHYCALLNVHVGWLLTGIGPKSNAIMRNIPIIDWKEVTAFPNMTLENKPKTTSDIDLSTASFALRVDNDAMEPRYPEGTIILIDTEQKPQNKDFALILTKEKKVPIFKQLLQVDGEWYAKSLNPDYKPICINKGMQIIGKVVQAKLLLSSQASR